MPSRHTLTVKQRRFVRRYLETGNGTQAALVAYDTHDPNTAHAIAAETLQSPTVQAAVTALLDAEGLSDQRLREIHAHLLALYASPDPREKAIACRALHMAYQLRGSYAPQRHEIDVLFDAMTVEELDHFAKSREWPDRFADQLMRVPGGRALPAPAIAGVTPTGAASHSNGEREVVAVNVPPGRRCFWSMVEEEHG